MAQPNWNQFIPSSLPRAGDMCIKHAQLKLNRGVELLSECEGIEANQFTLYKWVSTGRMPACKILPFERACGIDYLTRYLAHGHNKLLLPVPSGRRAENRELNALSLEAHETLGAILRFYDGQLSAGEAVVAITALMEDLAFYRGNIAKHQQPELNLEG